MTNTHHLFDKMPHRDSLASTPQPSSILRRSPRFLHPTTTPVPRGLSAAPRQPRKNSAAKSQDPETPKSKPRRNIAKSSDCGDGKENKKIKEKQQQHTDTVVRKSHRLLELKEKADDLGSSRTPESGFGINNVVRSLKHSIDSMKLRNGNARRREARVLVNSVSEDENEGSGFKRVSKKLGVSGCGSRNGGELKSETRKGRKLKDVSDGLQTPRRSSRLVCMQNVVEKEIDKANNGRSKYKSDDSGEMVERKSKRVSKKSSVGGADTISVECEGGRDEKLDCGDIKVAVGRKRRRGEEDVKVAKGWTKEQELAVHRAYLLAKPTPSFWKQVAKMVPGKTAQDCFDRIHSDHITPPQPPPRSRAKITTNPSPLGGFSLSASKVLNPIESKVKRRGYNKQGRHLAQKTVRALLHKHSQVNQDVEADLFSVLEPSVCPSTETSEPSAIPSTPSNLQVKQGFLHKSSQISPSGQKNPISRFSNPSDTSLVSPPVLKKVKNKILHEKYIDQLQIREAKRKALAKNAKKLPGGVDETTKIHIQEVNLRSAKFSLVSDAKEAINKLKHLEENSSESDDGIARDDEEDEDATL